MRCRSIAAAVLVTSSAVLAQTGPELMLNPMKPEARLEANASETYFFDTDVQHSRTNFQMTRYTVDARYRVLTNNEADPRVGFSFTNLHVKTDVPGFPSDFTDVSIGGGTGIAKIDGWVAGLVVGVGHASTNTFGDGSAYYGMATLMVGKQLDDVSSIGVALDYNGNRSFMPDVPLPGFVYTRKVPENNMEFSVGFPNAYGRWRPIDPLLLEVNFTFPDFVGGRVSYDLTPGVGLFGSLARRMDAYHDPDLENDIDRILLEQTQAEAGIRLHLDDRFVLLVAGGYAFNQSFRVGFDTRDTKEYVDLDDGYYARIEGQLRF